jgi:hypothetical protein
MRPFFLFAILSADGRSAACTVTNISAKGAKLTLSASGDLPSEFTLCILGSRHRSRLVWRVGLQAIVEFVG